MLCILNVCYVFKDVVREFLYGMLVRLMYTHLLPNIPVYHITLCYHVFHYLLHLDYIFYEKCSNCKYTVVFGNTEVMLEIAACAPQNF
jgi:hypothetical protein